jgi:hypothetical protein
MEAQKEFEILFRKKIPYWSELLFAVMVAFFTFLFLLYLVMLPSGKASGEMKVAYYILVVPEWLKQASGYSFIGLLLLMPIYEISKAHENALLKMDGSNFKLSGANMDRTIPVDSIKKIMLNDVRHGFRRKEAIEVVIKQSYSRTTSFLLKHHLQVEELVQALSIYDNIEFAFYNEYSMMTHDDD